MMLRLKRETSCVLNVLFSQSWQLKFMVSTEFVKSNLHKTNCPANIQLSLHSFLKQRIEMSFRITYLKVVLELGFIQYIVLSWLRKLILTQKVKSILKFCKRQQQHVVTSENLKWVKIRRMKDFYRHTLA